MSKKHIEEQKLLIENFNKWINEEKCGEKELDETAEPIEEEEDEDLNEIIGITAVTYASAKFLTSFQKLLGAYNEFSKISDEMMQNPNTPDKLKQIAGDVKDAGADIASASGDVAKDMPLGQKLTNKAINALIKKHFNIDANIDVGKIKMPTSSSPEPTEPETTQDEPIPDSEERSDDSDARAKLGLLPQDREDRLKQLRAKYRSEK